MKALINLSIVCFTTVLMASACAPSSRVVVHERPVVVRQAPPYAGAVWITEEWRGRPGRYRYVAPHYEHSRGSKAWVPGYWNNDRGRKVWVKGYWR